MRADEKLNAFVHADEKLRAFVELERQVLTAAIHSSDKDQGTYFAVIARTCPKIKRRWPKLRPDGLMMNLMCSLPWELLFLGLKQIVRCISASGSIISR